jgi:hypothetical protein
VPCVDGSGTPTTSSSPDGTGRGDALGARSAVPATGVDPDDAEAPLRVTDEGCDPHPPTTSAARASSSQGRGTRRPPDGRRQAVPE